MQKQANPAFWLLCRCMLHATGVDKSSPQSKARGAFEARALDAPHPLGPATGEGPGDPSLGAELWLAAAGVCRCSTRPDPHEPLPQRAIDEKLLQPDPGLQSAVETSSPLSTAGPLQSQGRRPGQAQGAGCGSGWSITGKQRSTGHAAGKH